MEKTDDTSSFKEKYGDLGTIRIQVWRETTHGERELGDRTAKAMGTVPEKALKGRPLEVATRFVGSWSRCIQADGNSFVATPAVAAIRSVKTERLDKKPLVTFYFKYRTRRTFSRLKAQFCDSDMVIGALQSLLILGRSPTPVPLEDRPYEELSREEALELLRRERVRSITLHEGVVLTFCRRNVIPSWNAD